MTTLVRSNFLLSNKVFFLLTPNPGVGFSKRNWLGIHWNFIGSTETVKNKWRLSHSIEEFDSLEGYEGPRFMHIHAVYHYAQSLTYFLLETIQRAKRERREKWRSFTDPYKLLGWILQNPTIPLLHTDPLLEEDILRQMADYLFKILGRDVDVRDLQSERLRLLKDLDRFLIETRNQSEIYYSREGSYEKSETSLLFSRFLVFATRKLEHLTKMGYLENTTTFFLDPQDVQIHDDSSQDQQEENELKDGKDEDLGEENKVIHRKDDQKPKKQNRRKHNGLKETTELKDGPDKVKRTRKKGKKGGSDSGGSDSGGSDSGGSDSLLVPGYEKDRPFDDRKDSDRDLGSDDGDYPIYLYEDNEDSDRDRASDNKYYGNNLDHKDHDLGLDPGSDTPYLGLDPGSDTPYYGKHKDDEHLNLGFDQVSDAQYSGSNFDDLDQDLDYHDYEDYDDDHDYHDYDDDHDQKNKLETEEYFQDQYCFYLLKNRDEPLVHDQEEYLETEEYFQDQNYKKTKKVKKNKNESKKNQSPDQNQEGTMNQERTLKYGHLWVPCENCSGLNYKKYFFPAKLNICEHCGSHLKISSSERIELPIDQNTWTPMDEDMISTDPIKFDRNPTKKNDFTELEIPNPNGSPIKTLNHPKKEAYSKNYEHFLHCEGPIRDCCVCSCNCNENTGKRHICHCNCKGPIRDCCVCSCNCNENTGKRHICHCKGPIRYCCACSCNCNENTGKRHICHCNCDNKNCKGPIRYCCACSCNCNENTGKRHICHCNCDNKNCKGPIIYCYVCSCNCNENTSQSYAENGNPFVKDSQNHKDLDEDSKTKILVDSNEDSHARIKCDDSQNSSPFDVTNSADGADGIDSESKSERGNSKSGDDSEDCSDPEAKSGKGNSRMGEEAQDCSGCVFESEENDYNDRIFSYQEETGLTEAVQTGTGELKGIPVAIGVMDFQFLGGSMGSVVGEKITRLIEYATKKWLPVILVCASGGARMQEGSLSLMQMAKISAALHKYQTNLKLFYISILTSPTTGGVTASFGMLGDLNITEPNADIAFAGKRVIEQTLNLTVPEDLQTAENFFQKGLLDLIVPRNLLKTLISELLKLHDFFPVNENQVEHNINKGQLFV
uniref:Acetyl-coenzyme A carboxylase carboxyl transferase subunit beta, chloroplastic n=1 Tax=Rhipsalis teres TaxID=169218 RepID=A0A894JI63_9CARY|nr:acetyl-CoA carboxylase carboxyltransferase beta subunit [Rhipsalis teres]QRV60098.1 acetyl-CoA carboxylase carboxyltransferase beta subunit [Rhipsalis teres]